MLVCFTSDLHGDADLYQQLADLLTRERPQVLILGGDLFADGAPADPVRSQIAQVNDEFVPRVDQWKRDVPGLEVAVLGGNHDWAATIAAVRRHHVSGRVELLSLDTAWRIDHTDVLGYHCTPWTPHFVKDFERLDLPHDPLPADGEGQVSNASTGAIRGITAAEHYRHHAAILEDLEAAAHVATPWIFVCHAPPRGTNLDRLPNIAEPIGSRAVRRFIEERQPLLSLHGHVHESPQVSGHFTDRIGQTLCVNPGQGHHQLHAVLFDISNPAQTLRHTVLTQA